METIVINTEEPSKMKQIIAFLNSLNVSFELKKNKKTKEYNKEFVEKIERSRKEYKEGKFTTIKMEDLWK